MKKITFLLTLISLFIVNISLSQSAGNVVYDRSSTTTPQKVNVNVNVPYDNYAFLQADVLINLKATSYTAIFSATQNGITASETDSLMNIRLKTVKNALFEIGIPENEIHIDIISLVPTYSLKLENKKFTKTANEIPTGFKLMKNIHIIFYDHEKLSEIVALMAQAEIYDIVKVDYNLADIQAAYDTLRRAAVHIIKLKEQEFPKMNLHLEVVNMADGFEAIYPIERYSSYTAFYTGSSVEEVKVAKKKKEQAKNVYVTGKNPTINVKTSNEETDDDSEFIVKYSDKNKTIFYNKVPYNQFDLVLNADFVEPRIQLCYTLKAKYSVMNKENFDEMKATEKEAKEKEKEKEKKSWFNKN